MEQAVNDALTEAARYYREQVLPLAGRGDAHVEEQLASLERARSTLAANGVLTEEEAALLRRVAESYLGQLSRGGYSGGQPPSRAQVASALELRELVIGWPQLQPLDSARE